MENINLSGNITSYPQTSVDAAAKTPGIQSASAGRGAGDAPAAVYEKNTPSVAKVRADQATIDRLKAEAEERTQSLKTLVERLISKQSSAYDIAMSVAEGGLANFYRSLEVDEAAVEQAKKDIAEDGYWGVEQTSERIVSFAKGLAGDDAEAAASMLEAVKKGFAQAEDEWGEKLPDLSQRTMEATYKKLNEWIDSLKKTTEPAADAASKAIIQQAATATLAE
ncbi:MAG: hypothetical protein ILP10_00445 [Lachnospiraceae bacterium]|nr:hypothetical protein [Lachnospiraceae bacterium]